MDSEYIISLQTFDKKIFSTSLRRSKGPKGGPPWDFNFSMDKIFSTFVFFVMRTPCGLRLFCFENFDKNFFSTLGVSIFRWLKFF